MSKNNNTYATYLVGLCSYIIQNVSNNVQTQRNPCILFEVTGRFILAAF